MGTTLSPTVHTGYRANHPPEMNLSLKLLIRNFRALQNSPFWALRLALSIALLVPCITGCLQVAGGPATTRKFSQDAPVGVISDPMLVSQYRFLAVVWLAYVGFIILILKNPPKYKSLLRILSLFVFFGGCARFYTAHRLGWPSSAFAKFLVVGATVLEFVFPALFEMFLRDGLRRDRQQRMA